MSHKIIFAAIVMASSLNCSAAAEQKCEAKSAVKALKAQNWFKVKTNQDFKPFLSFKRGIAADFYLFKDLLFYLSFEPLLATKIKTAPVKNNSRPFNGIYFGFRAQF